MKNRYEWTDPTYIIKQDDSRYKRFKDIKYLTGISPDQTWNLYLNICQFIIPRLQMYIQQTKRLKTYPASFPDRKSWVKVLKEILYTFKAIKKYDFDEIKDLKRIQNRSIFICNIFFKFMVVKKWQMK